MTNPSLATGLMGLHCLFGSPSSAECAASIKADAPGSVSKSHLDALGPGGRPGLGSLPLCRVGTALADRP